MHQGLGLVVAKAGHHTRAGRHWRGGVDTMLLPLLAQGACQSASRGFMGCSGPHHATHAHCGVIVFASSHLCKAVMLIGPRLWGCLGPEHTQAKAWVCQSLVLFVTCLQHQCLHGPVWQETCDRSAPVDCLVDGVDESALRSWTAHRHMIVLIGRSCGSTWIGMPPWMLGPLCTDPCSQPLLHRPGGPLIG